MNGTVNGSSIKFGTVGGTAVHYAGSVSGDSMSGSYSTSAGGGSWSAHKAGSWELGAAPGRRASLPRPYGA